MVKKTGNSSRGVKLVAPQTDSSQSASEMDEKEKVNFERESATQKTAQVENLLHSPIVNKNNKTNSG